MNAVVVGIDSLSAWAKTDGCPVFGLTLVVWKLPPLNGPSELVRLPLLHMFV